MKVYTQKEAVAETVRLLKEKGFLFISKSKSSYYLIRKIRRKCKVRISNHARDNVADCDKNIIYLEPTIFPDIEYRVATCR